MVAQLWAIHTYLCWFGCFFGVFSLLPGVNALPLIVISSLKSDPNGTLFFVLVFSILLVTGGISALSFLVHQRLTQQYGLRFIMVVAGAFLFVVPFGTLLGLLTLLLLDRDSVKSQFD